MLTKVALVAVTLALMGGCATNPKSAEPAGGSPAAWAAIAEGAPVRVAVFTGNGARSCGMFRWLQLMELSPDVRMTPVDGETIRAGALRDADLLVVPGGRATLEAINLQTNGLEEVRAFVHRGGSYIGTCAGCFLIMQYARGKFLSPLIPYMFWRNGDDPKAEIGPYLRSGIRPIAFNDRAKELIGIGGIRKIGYYGGPVMRPTGEAIADGSFEVLANYTPNEKQRTAKGVKLEDCAACVAGRYGKGRVVAFAVHPEMEPETVDIVQGAFRYLTGRNIRMVEPEQGGERLKVGLYVGQSLGPATAAWAAGLLHEPKLAITPLSTDAIAEGKLRPQQVLVVPDVPPADVAPYTHWQKKGVKTVADFLARGGRVITWGDVAKMKAFRTPNERLTVARDAASALKVLREMKERVK